MGIFLDMLAHGKWLFRGVPDRVTVDQQAAHGWCLEVEVWTAAWQELLRVQVETTDAGPYRDDCFMILETADRCFRVPSETPGFPNLIGGVTGELEGVDEGALVESMAFHENRTFPIWARPGSADAESAVQ